MTHWGVLNAKGHQTRTMCGLRVRRRDRPKMFGDVITCQVCKTKLVEIADAIHKTAMKHMLAGDPWTVWPGQEN